MEAFQKTGHILEHETNIFKFKMIEIVLHILSDHNSIKFKIDDKIL